MPLHDDHGKHNRLGNPKARGPHPPPHGPGFHPHNVPPHLRDAESGDGFYRQILELKSMGATEEDLHALIDSESERLISRVTNHDDHQVVDTGRGAAEGPIDAVNRARSLFQHAKSSEQDWMARLIGKRVIVVAEFPPHLLDRMLRSGIRITQIHPPTPDGDLPPHFHHLARRGLRGVIDFKALAEEAAEMLMFEGVRDAGNIFASPLVPVTLRMFPGMGVAMLDAEHRAPHMAVRIVDNGFICVPSFD